MAADWYFALLQVNIGRVDVVAVSGSSITVASRKCLQLDRYEATAAAAACDDDSNGSGSGSKSILWRLDRDEAASIGMHQRAAVLRLAADSSATQVQRLRELIVDSAAPRVWEPSQQDPDQQHLEQCAAGQPGKQQQHAQEVAAHTTDKQQTGSADVGAAAAPAADAGVTGSSKEPFGAAHRLAAASGERYLSAHGSHLNSNQVSVLRRVMAMQDYCLVLGMPGEGEGDEERCMCVLPKT